LPEKNRPKPNCPHKEDILDLISNKTAEYRKQAIEYQSQSKDFTVKTLIEKVNNPIKVKTVKEVFDLQIKRLISAKRLRYAEMHELVKNSLIKFNGHLDIYFSDIDTAWLKGYETFLRSNNLKENTIGIRFRTFLLTIAFLTHVHFSKFYSRINYRIDFL